MKLTPIEITSKDKDLQEITFQVALIVSKDNILQVIDTSKHDWKDYVDCDTLTVKEITIPTS
jgi:hypothetical protein